MARFTDDPILGQRYECDNQNRKRKQKKVKIVEQSYLAYLAKKLFKIT